MSVMTSLQNIRVPVQQKTGIYEPDEIRKAYKSVITDLLRDIFSLAPEECLWADYYLGQALELTKDSRIKDAPIAVEDELTTGKYSKGIFDSYQPTPKLANHDIIQASIEDWTSIFSEMIAEGFDTDTITHAGIYAIIKSLMESLGVGHPTNPRGAHYLPNAIRWKLNHSQ